MRHGRMSVHGRAASAVAVAILAMVALVAAAMVASAATNSENGVKLGPKLLAIGQMPAGWSLTSGGAVSGCLAQIPSTKGLKTTTSADVQFSVGGILNSFEEKLVVFSGPARRAFALVVHGFVACKHVSTTSGDLQWTGSFEQMSFPTHGSHSEAFRATIN